MLALHARGERKLATRGVELHRLHHRLTALHPRAQIAAQGVALGELARRLAAQHPVARITQSQRALDGLLARCNAAIQRRLGDRRAELARAGSQMAALSPLAVLDRGYAVVRKGDAIVRGADALASGDRVTIRFARGEATAVVEETS